MRTIDWSADFNARQRASFIPFVAESSLLPLANQHRTTWRDLTAGAVGCSMSHLGLYSYLVGHTHAAHLLILEDDAQWNEKLAVPTYGAFVEQLGAIAGDWDILCLGGRPIQVHQEYPTYSHIRLFWQTHAYIVTKAAALKLLLGSYPIAEPIDFYISRKIVENGLRVYMTKPQYRSDSSQVIVFSRLFRSGALRG